MRLPRGLWFKTILVILSTVSVITMFATHYFYKKADELHMDTKSLDELLFETYDDREDKADEIYENIRLAQFLFKKETITEYVESLRKKYNESDGEELDIYYDIWTGGSSSELKSKKPYVKYGHVERKEYEINRVASREFSESENIETLTNGIQKADFKLYGKTVTVYKDALGLYIEKAELINVLGNSSYSHLYWTDKTVWEDTVGTISGDIKISRFGTAGSSIGLFSTMLVVDIYYTDGYMQKQRDLDDYGRFIKTLYTYKDYLLPVATIAVCVWILSIAMLLAVCGRRPKTDEIKLRAIDKIPNDAFLVLAFLVMWIAFRWVYDSVLKDVQRYCFIGVVYIVALIVILSWHTRAKAGCFFKGTLTEKAYRKIKSGAISMHKNLPLIWQALIVIGIVEIINMILIFIAGKRSPIMMIIGIIINIGFTGLALMYVLGYVKLKKNLEKIAEGKLDDKISEDEFGVLMKEEADLINRIGNSLDIAVEDRMKSERMKTELITNVSHDLKTPITSIINYVDLLKKEDIANETALSYIDVLERQSERLRNLANDLIDASKASSGNLEVNLTDMKLHEFLIQLGAEYEEKYTTKNLRLIYNNDVPELNIRADVRHMFRAFDNLFQNIYKYAMEGSRVYLTVTEEDGKPRIELKNISGSELNISPDELTERFVRGDASRNTEGSGLGLSISKSLLKLMGFSMTISIDGDLFKVVVK